MNEFKKTSISIITATYNAAKELPGLIKSLETQSDQDFTWIVVDGASSDATLEMLEGAKNKLRRVVIDSRPDFGIYDALNRGVKLTESEYYIVAGADDKFKEFAIEKYKAACADGVHDFVTANLVINNKEVGIKFPRWSWFYGQCACVAGHAVATAIKKDLHKKNGLYSRQFPIAADQLFILKSIKNGAMVKEVNFIAGYFDNCGVSGSDLIGGACELFRVQIVLGRNVFVQFFMLTLRVVRSYFKK